MDETHVWSGSRIKIKILSPAVIWTQHVQPRGTTLLPPPPRTNPAPPAHATKWETINMRSKQMDVCVYLIPEFIFYFQ